MQLNFPYRQAQLGELKYTRNANLNNNKKIKIFKVT